MEDERMELRYQNEFLQRYNTRSCNKLECGSPHNRIGAEVYTMAPTSKIWRTKGAAKNTEME